MRSRNPVFARADGFNGKANAYGNPTYAGNGQGYAGYGDPSTWSIGQAGAATGVPPTHAPGRGQVSTGPMTIDSVVQKTAITGLVVIIAAALTWALSGDLSNPATARTLYGLSLVGAIGGFVLAMVNSFKKVVSPALVLAYAALEGICLGAVSKAIDSQTHGAVIGAVLGTFAAVAGTLAAYKFFHIKVGDRFRRGVTAAMFGFVAVTVLDFVLGLFGASFGFNGFGTIGAIGSAIGLVIGILMLILDFDSIERGVAAGLPERESWRAAFGLTVTIIWIYIEILRLISIFTRN